MAKRTEVKESTCLVRKNRQDGVDVYMNKKSVGQAVHQKLKCGICTAIKCPRCNYVAKDGEKMHVRGVAERGDGRMVKVNGTVVWSYHGPYCFEGIDWDRLDIGSSDGEKVRCVACGKRSSLDKWGFYNL